MQGKSSLYIAREFVKLGVLRYATSDATRLMRMVYIAHGYYLAWYDRPLISEDVEAWECGPVIPALHTCLERGRTIALSRLDGDCVLTEEEKEHIEKIFKAFNAHTLEQLEWHACCEKGPWAKIRGARMLYTKRTKNKHEEWRANCLISESSIKEFYHDIVCQVGKGGVIDGAVQPDQQKLIRQIIIDTMGVARAPFKDAMGFPRTAPRSFILSSCGLIGAFISESLVLIKGGVGARVCTFDEIAMRLDICHNKSIYYHTCLKLLEEYKGEADARAVLSHAGNGDIDTLSAAEKFLASSITARDHKELFETIRAEYGEDDAGFQAAKYYTVMVIEDILLRVQGFPLGGVYTREEITRRLTCAILDSRKKSTGIIKLLKWLFPFWR